VSIHVAILVSGRGSNLEAILRAIKDGELDATAHVVISSNPEALALHVARKYGVHAIAIDNKGLTRHEHERLLLEELSRYPIDYLVLAGYMRILSPQFLRKFQDPRGFYRVINIHPSLLPAFPGAHAYEDAFQAGVRVSGITVHLVDEKVDHGPILAQETFPRLPDDTPESFKARGLAIEHRLYPAVLQEIARNGVQILPAQPLSGPSTQERSTPEHGMAGFTPARAKHVSTPVQHKHEVGVGGASHASGARQRSDQAKTSGSEADVDRLLCLAVMPRSGFPRGSTPVEFPLYWLLADEPASALAEDEALIKELSAILADPLLEDLWCVTAGQRSRWAKAWAEADFAWWGERQYLPGVTDNLAHTVQEALGLSGLPYQFKVASGSGLLFRKSESSLAAPEDVERSARYRFFHPLTDRFIVHDLERRSSEERFLGFPAVHLPEPEPVEVVNLDLPEAELTALSRRRILALSLREMQAIRLHYEQESVKAARKERGLPEWPTDVELEIIAQTWSEHCKHKIFNAVIQHTDLSRPESLRNTTIDSLFKTYIRAATKKLADSRRDLLSVFVDNAGVVRWDENWGVCFKVETHNSPSALEPYGGALTGILGVNRDILGTGLGARPICNTDVFCFAYPSPELPHRPSMLPAETIIQGVRKGVQDGGNKSGIPTVNGAVFFDAGYRAKPLVFCGTVGLLPLQVDGRAGHEKHTRSGDTIVMAGGRVGKDGIHGATFSSEALHEGSPVSAVQIGDPFTQKRLLDFVLEARDKGLITGITDNGAGGLSSSVGEMAQLTGGATLELDNIPLKYPGLADYEIVISESQERMTISTRNFAELEKLAGKHSVEITAVGRFHDRGCFEITRHGKPVAMLDLDFLHGGAPTLELKSRWEPVVLPNTTGQPAEDLEDVLIQLLSHPNICSRESVIRQYDHEVQGASVIKPLGGPLQRAPSDAAVIKPIFNQDSGIAIANGLCPQLSRCDTYLMAACAVDEAVRNLVCVGANPDTISLLDNFCWPDPVPSERNPDAERKLAQLVRACEGLFDAVLAYGAPLISGKDSMKNDFDDGTLRLSIPPTLLVSAIARVDRIDEVVTMDFKSPGDLVYLVGAGELGLAGSHYACLNGWESDLSPCLDLAGAARLYKLVHQAVQHGLVESAHDLSEGGLAVALAECVIGSGLGVEIRAERAVAAAASAADQSPSHKKLRERLDVALFGEGPARLLVTVSPAHKEEFEQLLNGTRSTQLGVVTKKNTLCLIDNHERRIMELELPALVKAWKAPLPLEGGEVSP
jgi:phosphoribosylformylglycinamidine synthase